MAASPTTDSWHLAAIERAAARISSLARGGDLETPVEHLNRWRVRDVIAHLGGVHCWATRIVNERSMTGPGFKKSKLDGSALCDWFDDGVEGLIDEFHRAGLDAPCPNFNPGSEHTVGWWARRQAHETTVHCWDVEKALGSTTSITDRVAADGIDEFLDVFVRTRGKQTLTSPLALRTINLPRTWLLTPAKKEGRIDVMAEPSELVSATPATTVSGTPEALLLALWGRRSLAEAGLTIDGDPSVAESILTL